MHNDKVVTHKAKDPKRQVNKCTVKFRFSGEEEGGGIAARTELCQDY